jgi:hypothetical protein
MKRTILMIGVCLAVAAASMATQREPAQAWPWSTKTAITGRAICSTLFGIFVRDDGCSSARLRTDLGGYDKTVSPAKRSWPWDPPYGSFKFENVPINTWATLYIGRSYPSGRTCQSRVWISKPALVESLSIGDFNCKG